MPALPKLKKKKSSKKIKEAVQKPELVLHDSITEADLSDDSFFTHITRRVRFSASVGQQTIMSSDDYSESERKLTWYDKQDKAEMNKQHDKMVRRYEAGKRCKRGMTYRGLDAWTDKGHTKFEAVMDRMLSAVMDEQDDQWQRNINDPDRIAKAARNVSKRNLLQAIKFAQEDEYEAQEAYKEGDSKEEAAGSDEEENTSGHNRQNRRRSSTSKARRERRASKERPEKKDGKKGRKSKRRSSSGKKKSKQ